jgi:16S rRNA (guanine527-N7)-methyltransferase
VFQVKHAVAGVSRETVERLGRLAALLLRWNRSINLISIKDESALWERHIVDSLQLVPLMQPLPCRAIDLGSGAGFPGLVLALATDVPFDLIEADRRKAAFLREAGRLLDAPVRVHTVRIEAAEVPPAPLVTARALGPLPRILPLAHSLLAPGGQCLFLKGVTVEAELTHSAAEWHMQVERVPSRTAPDTCILRISDLSRVASPA